MNEEELKLVIANNIQKGWVSYGDFRTDVAVEAISEALTEQLRIGGVSQQRELLYAFANYVNNNELKSNEQITDYSVKKYIKSLQ